VRRHLFNLVVTVSLVLSLLYAITVTGLCVASH